MVSPNPMVGAVIVKGNRVIGEGHHRYFGGPHAEVEAIRNARTSVRGSTIYVNLEPCNIYGKTPPCTDLLIAKGIKKVVIGSKDPNPLVSGRGVRQLRRAGIEVRTGILAAECRKVNEVFEKFITERVPFVTLKVAQTIDGSIADDGGGSRWISNAASREFVHILRSQHDSVLVGANTVNTDDPELSSHSNQRKNPLRVVVDGDLKCRLDRKLFSDKKSPTIVITAKNSEEKFWRKVERFRAKGVDVIGLKTRDGLIPTRTLLKFLGSRGISSVLLEGGSQLFSQFISEQTADKCLIFISPKILGSGLRSFALPSRKVGESVILRSMSALSIGDDTLIEGYFR